MPLDLPSVLPPLGPQTDPDKVRVAAVVGGMLGAAPARGFGLTADELAAVEDLTAGRVATAETRNRIVNPAMQISQETSGNVSTNGGYPVDQFVFGSNLSGTTSAQKQPVSGPEGLSSLQTNITTAKPSLAAGDYWQLYQPIEGTRVSDFRWGTANAKQVVVRFWAFCTQAGTYTFRIQNGAANRCFMAPFTLAALTYTEITIVIPGDTTGTWPTDTSAGMTIGWGFAAGTTYGAGVAGWQAGNLVQMAGATNLAATASSAFYLSNVGLYCDPLNTGVAPPWVMPDEAEELRTCKRYYRPFPEFTGSLVTTAIFRTIFMLEPPMRIAPTVTMASTTVHIWHVANQAMSGAATISSGTDKIDYYIGITPAFSVSGFPASIAYSANNKLSARM